MRVIEVGLGLPVAFAGMVLAEQGIEVHKWLKPGGHDPLFDRELAWWWSAHGKDLIPRHGRELATLRPGDCQGIIDNLRDDTWQAWGVDRAAVARRIGVPWVSLADDVGYRSTGAIAAARSWWAGGKALEPDIAETTAGLMMAFKLLAMRGRGRHCRLPFAAALQKMVPCELMQGKDRRRDEAPPIKPEWWADGRLVGAKAEWRGELLSELVRDRAWKLRHMPTAAGRVTL